MPKVVEQPVVGKGSGGNLVDNSALLVTAFGDDVYGYWTYFKNGRLRNYQPHWYTPLFACEHCGYLGSRRKVQQRSKATHMVLTGGLTPTLCMGCWNRFRVLVNALEEVESAKRLLRKLKKEITHARRQDDGRKPSENAV